MNLRHSTTSISARPATRALFDGKTPTFLPRDDSSSSRKPYTRGVFEGKNPTFSSIKTANSSKKPVTRAVFEGTTPTFGSHYAAMPSRPKQHVNPKQLKLVTLTYECGHRRYVSQLGNGAIRDHVDAGSMLRSVHPTVKPLIANHRPEAEYPSCRYGLSGDNKVLLQDKDGEEDNDDDSEYDTADAGEDEMDEDEIHGKPKSLLKWWNRRTEVQGLLI